MRKNIAKTLIASLCTAFVLSGAAGLFTAFSSAKASADTTATALPADELLIPSTYKQYLALDAPKDIAVSENFTAIADGNILYLYDETEEIYRKYTHDKHGVDSSKNVITQIQFDQSGNLYFTDDFTSDNLYVLNPKTLAPPTRIDEVACRAFALYGESLYFTNSQGTLYYAALNDTANAQDVITNVSAFCLQGDELYLVRSEFYLHKLHSPTNKLPESEVQSTSVTTLYGSVKSLQVKNNTIAYTTVAGDFYAHPISLGVLSNEHIVHDANGYANINSFGDYIYAVKNQTVRQFNPESKAFTSFEICAKSTQANRLSGATDILQAGEKLYIADNGNHRISVYNTKTNAFETSFHTHLPPSFMSLDGDCLLVANEQTAALYSLRSDTFGTLIASAENFASPIKGVAAVYGNYYIACEGYAYTLTKDGVCEGKEKTAFYPELFTSDIYGNLYTLQNGGILRFTESQFLSPDESGDRLCTCSVSGVKKLAVDYKRDIYALTDTAVHKLGESVVQTDFSSPIVY
ncbi:MAG: hypothetical protein J6U60_00780, partial [Clostridia bacterium]|nr:hypothetical protein [Clostridia bacterium]